MDEIKKAHENYLKQRHESILNYNVKYEYDVEFSKHDRGELTLDEFEKMVENDTLFANKWLSKK